ncbi:MAG: hypothetical protein ABIH72_01670 [archaeon]
MLWKKKKADVIDLSMLHKRGIIKAPEREVEELDLTKTSVSSEDTSGMDFLGALASSSGSKLEKPGLESSMKNKVEDIEFKLESMLRRVDKLIDRIDLVEKKLNRFEGK